MIPILYESTETTFASNGIGRLSDCISCTVTEERNGEYELEMEYPVGGIHFDDITPGRIIAVIHDDNNDIQPFDIYRKEEPIDGIVKFNAHHISYRLNENAVAGYSANSVVNALAGIRSHAFLNCPFSFGTDKTTVADWVIHDPTTIRSALGGVDGSILDVYGGEYEFNNFAVYLWSRRGSDKNVQIRYRSNLTDYKDETDFADVYNAVIPYWTGTDDETNEETTVIGTIVYSGQSIVSGRTALLPMDLSDVFETTPTVSDLNNAAHSRLMANMAWEPSENITLSFVPLWNTDEYKDMIAAQKLNLCDTAEIYFDLYNKSARMKVVKVVYNVLAERYDEIEFGNLQTTLADALTADIQTQVTKQQNEISAVGRVAGNTTQHFWFNSNGVDTGAHITEVDRATFEADRANGGANFLARTNGLAVRDGLTELATFTATAAVVGALGTSHIVTSTNGIELFDDNGASVAEFGSISRLGAASGPHIVQRVDTIGTDDFAVLDFRSGSGDIASVYASKASDDIETTLYQEGYNGGEQNRIDLKSYKRYDNIDASTFDLVLSADDNSESVALSLDTHLSLITSTRKCCVLWSGTPSLMQARQTAPFTGEVNLISQQLSGVVLVWSRWANSQAQNDSWWYEFIPKWHVLTHNGGGVYMSTPTSATSATVCNKYIYVYDDRLEGYTGNNATGTGYANNTRVLRAVLGV